MSLSLGLLSKKEAPELQRHLEKVQSHAFDALLSTYSLQSGGMEQPAKQAQSLPSGSWLSGTQVVPQVTQRVKK